MDQMNVAIAGAGVGGLVAAIALRRQGIDAVVFEQSARFARVGADINLTANAVRALDGLGGRIGEQVRDLGARPQYRLSRTWDTGEVTSRIRLGDEAEDKYGAPQLTLHRADLMSVLEAEADGAVQLGRRVSTVAADAAGATLTFGDGSTHRADLVVGADGIHSRVREAILGPDHPEFTGIVAFRAVIPADRVGDLPNADSFTKWWGPDSDTQIVTFPLGRDEVFVFATVGQPEWEEESWTTPGTVAELMSLYGGFHPDARALLERCGDVLKSALYVREPLSTWSAGRAVLVGDACHPMTPFMAQGAGQAIEDSVVLARCLAEGSGIEDAVASYESVRMPRTARIQRTSRGNDWLKEAGSGDWVYGYDAWSVPIR